MPDVIKDVVKGVISGLAKEKRLSLEEISAVWKQVVGAKTCGYTKPTSLKKGRLTVNVESSPWLYELNIKSEQIRQKLNKKLRERKIRVNSINFRIGEV